MPENRNTERPRHWETLIPEYHQILFLPPHRYNMHMAKNVPLLFILSVLCFASLCAQQAPQYSLYHLNTYAFNPAYGGLDGSVSINGVYRTQWTELAGAPISRHLNAHVPLYFIGGGIGLRVESETIGVHDHLLATASYSYYMPVGKTGLLSIGLAAGIIQNTIDGTKLRAPEGQYPEPPTINHNDPFLSENKEQAISPTVDAGIYLLLDRLQVGIAVSHLIEPGIDFAFSSGTDFTYRRNYFFNAAYAIPVSEVFVLRPTLLLKSDLVQTQAEVTLRATYAENIFAGASYRGYNTESRDAVVLFAGLKLSPKITAAYAFDITLSSLNAVSDGSHEILLNYNLNKPTGKGKPPRIIYNPRFLD